MAMGILSGALTEGLMVLATRQHVRAWEGELESVHRKAAWQLYEELWRWSSGRNSDLSPGERRALTPRARVRRGRAGRERASRREVAAARDRTL